MGANCTECDRLSQVYARASSTYLSLYKALSAAAEQREMKFFVALAPICQAAEEHRAAADEAIQKHAALSHRFIAKIA